MSGVEPDTRSTVVRDRHYSLPRHVYACRTDDGVVFLDAKRDRYFGLGGAGVMALPDFVGNWPTQPGRMTKPPMDAPDIRCGDPTPIPHAEVQQVADKLIEQGLLCRGGDEAPLISRVSVPPLAMDRPGVVMESRGELGPVDFIYFALACSRALWYLKRLPLEVIASRVTAARRQEGPLDLVQVFGRVQAFRRLRRLLFSDKDRCLLNALALVLFLRRYRLFPLFVIGVKTRPFAAHSWVQHEQILLEGDPASVCHFVPILVA